MDSHADRLQGDTIEMPSHVPLTPRSLLFNNAARTVLARRRLRRASLRLDLDDSALETLAERISERLTPLPAPSPWMDFQGLVEYTRIPAGTLRKLTASGLIPSHGGKSKVYHRDEVDNALRGLNARNTLGRLGRAG
jgi:hypothetical protein